MGLLTMIIGSLQLAKDDIIGVDSKWSAGFILLIGLLIMSISFFGVWGAFNQNYSLLIIVKQT